MHLISLKLLAKHCWAFVSFLISVCSNWLLIGFSHSTQPHTHNAPYCLSVIGFPLHSAWGGIQLGGLGVECQMVRVTAQCLVVPLVGYYCGWNVCTVLLLQLGPTYSIVVWEKLKLPYMELENAHSYKFCSCFCYHTLRIAGNVVYCLPMHYCTSRSRLLVFKPIRFFCVARSLFLMFANRRLAVLWGLCPYLASIWHPLHLYGGLECVGTLVAYLATPGPSYLHFH